MLLPLPSFSVRFEFLWPVLREPAISRFCLVTEGPRAPAEARRTYHIHFATSPYVPGRCARESEHGSIVGLLACGFHRLCRTYLLEHSPYTVNEGLDVSYKFAVCAHLQETCDGRDVVAMKTLNGKCINSFGNASSVRASLLGSSPQSGVRVRYQGGPPCGQNHVAPSTTIDVKCDKSKSAEVTSFAVSDDECGITFEVSSKSGCPEIQSVLAKLSAGSIFLILFAVFITVYLTAGILYKRAVHGASGMESIPNVDTWRAFFSNVRIGALYLWDTVTCSQRSDDVYHDLNVEADQPEL